MLLHPGILALISGSTVVLLMVMYAALLGTIIVLRWNFDSSSAYQLSLERKTYLISTIMNYVLGFEIVSAFLFIYTVDDIHTLFTGAMCATGSLNANPVGWYTLMMKIAVFFFSGLWIALNYLDQRAEDYPFVRLKYSLLIVLLPMIGLDLFLQLQYFLGLDPDIITSCCGSLFSESGAGVASSMSALPAGPAMVFFYTVVALFLGVSGFCLYSKKSFLRYLQSLLSGALFFVALAAVVSFVSMYIYELPTHHCPFDIFQGEYGFIGYPLYISLFGGTFFGLLPGLFQPLKRVVSVQETIDRLEGKWVIFSMGCFLIFVGISTYSVVFSNLTFNGY